jgi:hypothetical protein
LSTQKTRLLACEKVDRKALRARGAHDGEDARAPSGRARACFRKALQPVMAFPHL